MELTDFGWKAGGWIYLKQD